MNVHALSGGFKTYPVAILYLCYCIVHINRTLMSLSLYFAQLYMFDVVLYMDPIVCIFPRNFPTLTILFLGSLSLSKHPHV